LWNHLGGGFPGACAFCSCCRGFFGCGFGGFFGGTFCGFFHRRLAGRCFGRSLEHPFAGRFGDFLGGFDFRGTRCDEPTVNFSGGEKARLALALIAWQRPNLLLLDEPTNHLDLEMRHALTLALQEFSGAVLLVSHDRHLLKSTCDEFWLVAHQRIEVFSGSLDDYARWLVEFRAQQKPLVAPTEGKEDRREQRKQAAQQRQQRSALKKQAEKLEAQLSVVQEKLAALQNQLAEGSLYDATQKEQLRLVLAEQRQWQAQQEHLEQAWLEALEALEAGQ